MHIRNTLSANIALFRKFNNLKIWPKFCPELDFYQIWEMVRCQLEPEPYSGAALVICVKYFAYSVLLFVVSFMERLVSVMRLCVERNIKLHLLLLVLYSVVHHFDHFDVCVKCIVFSDMIS